MSIRSPTKSLRASASFDSSYIVPDLKTPEQYYADLLHRAEALESVREITATRTYHAGYNESRVSEMRTRVDEAFEEAGGERANGTWAAIPRILRLQCTSSGNGRYIGTNSTKRDRESENTTWILADTDEQWEEWMQRREKTRRVENWSKSVAVETAQDPAGPQTPSRKLPVKPKLKAQSAMPKTKSSPLPTGTLPFPVVKRASLQSVGKPRTAAVISLPSTSSPRKAKDINDIHASTFLPPSFPSDLVTSTPPAARAKPSPIPTVPETSSPLTSGFPSATKKRRLSPSPEKDEKTKKLPTLSQLLSQESRPSTPQSPMRSRPSPIKNPSKPKSMRPSFPSPMAINTARSARHSASPDKSMQSIRENSNEMLHLPDFSLDPDEFQPMAASTQQNQRHADMEESQTQETGFVLAYNSQAIDVETSVNRLNRFLDVDMDMDSGAHGRQRQSQESVDYGGWVHEDP